MTRFVHTLGRTTVSALLAMVVTTGLAYAHDAKLDEADAALANAITLLQGAQPGAVSESKQKGFAKHVKEALQRLNKARLEITKAKQIVDTP